MIRRLRNEGAAHIGSALCVNTGLRCLVLWSNGIAHSGIAALSDGLKVNNTLQVASCAAATEHGTAHTSATHTTLRPMSRHHS